MCIKTNTNINTENSIKTANFLAKLLTKYFNVN